MKDKFFILVYIAVLAGCGEYRDSLKKRVPYSDKLTISEIRNLDNVHADYTCYAGINIITDVMKGLFPVGHHQVEIPPEIYQEIADLLQGDTPSLNSFSTYIIPDLNTLLEKHNIPFREYISISDWDFGATTIGKHHIFFPARNEEIKPFYTAEMKNKYGIPTEYRNTEKQKTAFTSLLAHEMTHLAQVRQKRADEKVSKSCVVQYGLSKSARYDYSISTVKDLFTLGMEASAEFVENTITLKHGYASSSHDVEGSEKNTEDNFKQHLEIIKNSSGL